MTNQIPPAGSKDRYRDWDASYTLGALSIDERLEYEEHLEACAECRAAVFELAGMPGILSRLPTEDAVALSDPSAAPPARLGAVHGSTESLQSTAHAARRFRRRRNILQLAVAAAAIVLALAGGTVLGSAPTRPSSTLQAAGSMPMTAVNGNTSLTAALRLTAEPWGTRLDWSCSYRTDEWISASTTYDLVATRRDGTVTTIGTWTADGNHSSGLAASTDIVRRDLRSIDIRVHGSSSPLVQAEL